MSKQSKFDIHRLSPNEKDEIVNMVAHNLGVADQGMGHGHYELRLAEQDIHRMVELIQKGIEP